MSDESNAGGALFATLFTIFIFGAVHLGSWLFGMAITNPEVQSLVGGG